jgi:hypothetical protein
MCLSPGVVGTLCLLVSLPAAEFRGFRVAFAGRFCVLMTESPDVMTANEGPSALRAVLDRGGNLMLCNQLAD